MFIDKKQILKLIKNKNIKTVGYPIDSVNTLKIEKIVAQHPSVKKVRSYCSINGDLYIDISQREPLFRVINYNGESYYIDKTGKMMQLYDKYTARVPIVNGNINEPFESRFQLKFSENEYADELKRGKILSDIFNLVSYIQNDEFWKTEIQQIFVENDSNFVLIPIVGIHKIKFGNIENYKKKLRNLKAFYKNGITKKGWNKYSEINLKYENQIVCKKRKY
jgi:cell division protein FtsQ